MTIYVDELREWGKSKKWMYTHSCHMFCDGPFEELHKFAESIGLKRAWFQHHAPRPTLWHYDCTASKRALAIQHGAVEITSRQYSTMIHEAIEKQQSGILRHACGHEEQHNLEPENLPQVRQLMAVVCSECQKVAV